MFNGVITFANSRPRRFAAALVALSFLAAACSAWAEPVKIAFLPPPMEGSLSLGIYDKAGKLVRVLHREAQWSELTPGDDGLVTQWDGKDDQGKPCPAGSYCARGVAVGDLGVEGVDFIGNDWVTEDDSPHVQRIIALATSGIPVIAATLPGQPGPAFYSIAMKPAANPNEDPEPQLIREPKTPPILTQLKATDRASSRADGSVWIIEDAHVKHYSTKGKVLQTLAAQAGDPPPVKLAASATEDKVYVLYENAKLQRLRGYDFTGVKPGAEPKVLCENDLSACDSYEQIASELKFADGKPFVPSPVLTVALVPNPLANNKPGTLQIRVGVDKTGSYLAAADGLPLCHINETKELRWAVMGQPAGSTTVAVFDSDGAVVEQFQVSKIANMMAFDAGVVQWSGEPAAPTAVSKP